MEIILKININDANKLLGALGKFPLEQVFDLVVSIRRQVAEQTAQAASIVPPPPE